MSNEELVEHLGQLIDTADNYLEYTKDTTFTKMLPPAMRLESLGNLVTQFLGTNFKFPNAQIFRNNF
jgi:hypothetical protein